MKCGAISFLKSYELLCPSNRASRLGIFSKISHSGSGKFELNYEISSI